MSDTRTQGGRPDDPGRPDDKPHPNPDRPGPPPDRPGPVDPPRPPKRREVA